MSKALSILQQAPMVPVIALQNLEQAVPLAEALVRGGLPVLEITLRTPAGLPAIRAIADAVPGAIVGAGTVRNPADFRAAIDAGSEFVITPGITQATLDTAATTEVPLIPGIATASELMLAMDHGLHTVKFFPAEASGGAAALKALAGPFPEVRFCPTGGIGMHNLTDYLDLPTVITVGGSWVMPQALLDSGDWDSIATRAREVVRVIDEHTRPKPGN